MIRLFSYLNCILLVIGSVQLGFSAQSTNDTAATSELKNAARQEILGNRSEALNGDNAYSIGYGDILSVSVYGEGNMAAADVTTAGRQEQTEGFGGPQSLRPDAPRMRGNGVMVMTDGRVSLKHIGDVEVVGLTLTQLADYLKQLYATVFDDPIVTTTLVQSNSLRYTIMGNVAGPGIYFLDYPFTIVQTLARSGGFTEWASKDVTVVRENLQAGDDQLFKGNTLDFDYDSFISGKDLGKNIVIRSGDIIMVH